MSRPKTLKARLAARKKAGRAERVEQAVCMVCRRAPGTVEQGAARYCAPCAKVDPAQADAEANALAEKEGRAKAVVNARVYGATKGGGRAG